MDAVDDLSDAIDATRELLVPVQAGLWLKLAIVVFFVGGGLGMGGNVTTGDLGPIAEDTTIETAMEEIPAEVIAAAAVLIVAGLLIWLLYRLVGAIMEFVFIESLRSREVHVRRYSRENVGRGVRLFFFRLLTGLLVTGLVAVPALFLIVDAPTLEAALDSLVPLLILGAVVYLLYAIVMRFTSEFVAPIMLLEERSVLGAWSRFWSTLTGNVVEYVVYLVLVWILQLVLSIAAGFIIAFGALFLAIPFVILGVLAFMLGEFGVWLAAIVAVFGVLTIVLFAAVVQMPIRTYFQYYALLLLGDTNADLDLLPDQRAAIRADDDDRRDAGADRDALADRETDNRHEDEPDSWEDSDLWGDEDRGDWDARDDRSASDRDRDDDDDDSRDDDRGW